MPARSDGLTGSLSLALGPDGSMWAAELDSEPDQFWRISPDGMIDTFEIASLSAFSIAGDATQNVHVLSGALGVFKLVGADPLNIEQMTDRPFGSGTVSPSPSGDFLFITAVREVVGIHLPTGALVELSDIDGGPDTGLGATFYVPEPGSACVLLTGASLIWRRACRDELNSRAAG